MKKDKLNRQLLTAQLKAAQDWGNYWHTIYNTIQESINNTMDRIYRTINHKINKLEQTQPTTTQHQRHFYPRVINNTSIALTPEELTFLNKGLKYNLKSKRKTG
jgi:hypothetical protein